MNVDVKVIEQRAAEVCHEFEIFCDYVLQDRVKLAKKSGFIGKKDCFELNSHLKVREAYEKPTRFQADYLVINFFYYIAVKYHILEINEKGTGMIKGEDYELFWNASAIERYVLFLMILMCDTGFEKKETSFEWEVDTFMEWAEHTGAVPGETYYLPDRFLFLYRIGRPAAILCYLEELGVVKVEETDVIPDGEAVKHSRIKIQPLFNILCEVSDQIRLYNECEEDDTLIDFTFGQYMHKRFPEYCAGNISKMFEEQERDYSGLTVELKMDVRYGDCSRTVCLNLSDTLYTLHRTIQKVFEFDDDHLFAFYTGQGMMRETYTLDAAFTSGDEMSVDDTFLGDLDLRKGMKFSYLFDFGDMWWFDIKVLKISEGHVENPQLIRAVNPAPKQYPDW